MLMLLIRLMPPIWWQQSYYGVHGVISGRNYPLERINDSRNNYCRHLPRIILYHQFYRRKISSRKYWLDFFPRPHVIIDPRKWLKCIVNTKKTMQTLFFQPHFYQCSDRLLISHSWNKKPTTINAEGKQIFP